MKKTISILVLNILLFSCIILTQTQHATSETNNKNILYVGGRGIGNHTRIQDAIDIADPGDTILVYYGNYSEDIKINKENLTINGIKDNGKKPVITLKEGYTIRITKKNCVVSNFQICGDDLYPCILVSVIEGFYHTPSYCTISDNIISGGKEGIELSSGDNRIVRNNITNNKDGIEIVSKNNIIENNTIFGNNVGIAIPAGGGNRGFNIIQNNIIKNNTMGIALYGGGGNNTICKNIISNNFNGIYIVYSNNNLIYQNNFVKNIQATSDNANNSWYNDVLKVGNYWDDYTGEDNDGDGIGDTPYNIPGGENRDNYPLMKPYNNKTYEFIVNEETLYFMLLVSMIAAILFLLPIAYIWYKKQHKTKK